MRDSFQISVNNPCSKNFNQFKSTAEGGFCDSCAKEVIDFTQMSSKELKHYFKDRKEEVCGYFKKEQLKAPQQKGFRFIGAIGLSMVALLLTTSLNAQTQPVTSKTQIENTISVTAQDQETFSVTGTIVNSTDRLPIPGVSVVLKNTIKGTETDFNGKFTLENLKAGDVLELYYLGYTSKEVTIKNSSKISVSLEEDTEVLGTVYVIGAADTNQHYTTKRGLWSKVKSIF